MDITKMNKIIMWATDKNGEGYVMRLGEYDSIEDVVIHTSIFGDDVKITFEYDTERSSE